MGAPGAPLGEDTCAWAANNGHLAVLQWARAQGCPYDEDLWNDFVKGVNLEQKASAVTRALNLQGGGPISRGQLMGALRMAAELARRVGPIETMFLYRTVQYLASKIEEGDTHFPL